MIAVENLRNVENVLQMMERYKKRENVKYCYDCGHEHAYTPDTDWIKIFGNKLACVHIHDNLGYDRNADPDAHYLPFDGDLNWDDTLCRLAEAAPQEQLNFELKKTTRDPRDQLYDHLSLEQFIAEAGRRARTLALAYQKLIQTKKA